MKLPNAWCDPIRRRDALAAILGALLVGLAAAGEAAAQQGRGPYVREAAPRFEPRPPAPLAAGPAGGWPGYNSLPPEERQRLQQQYREWQALPPEKKEEMRRRLDEYRSKPPPQQDLYRQRYDQWRSLPPPERRRLEEKLRRWDELSPQEQESLRRRFRD